MIKPAQQISTTFAKVIEAPLQELFVLQNSKDLKRGQALYVQTLIAFLASDIQSMSYICQTLEQYANEEQSLESLTFFQLAQTRLAIRNRAVTPENINRLHRLTLQLDDGLLIGECYFVLGRASEILEQHEDAARYFDRSHREFQNCGCRAKSVKALFNSLANQTRIDPSLNYISEYRRLIKLARQIKDYGIVAVGLMNISRELEGMGALTLSLKYANRCLAFQQNDIGTQHFFMGLIHRAHIYIQLNQMTNAKRDLEQAQLSQHIEIKAAIKYLESQIQSSAALTFTIADFHNMTKCWQERVTDNLSIKENKREFLSSSEEKMVETLTIRPRTRDLLIEKQWGTRSGEPDSLLLRLKALFHRLRDKRKNLVIFENGNYRLSNKSWIVFSEPNSNKPNKL